MDWEALLPILPAHTWVGQSCVRCVGVLGVHMGWIWVCTWAGFRSVFWDHCRGILTRVQHSIDIVDIAAWVRGSKQCSGSTGSDDCSSSTPSQQQQHPEAVSAGC